MPQADWLSTICVVGMLVVVAVVAVDRNRLKHRLNNSEGRLTKLTLDVTALRDRVAELTSYLNRPTSWDVDEEPPAAFTDARPADRHDREPAAPESGRAANETQGRSADGRTADGRPADGRQGARRQSAGGPGAGGHVSDSQRSVR